MYEAWLYSLNRAIQSWWCARQDLNPYPRGMEPKSIVSANSTTGAYKQPKNIVTFINYTEKARAEIYTYLNVHATPLDHWRFAPLQRLLR